MAKASWSAIDQLSVIPLDRPDIGPKVPAAPGAVSNVTFTGNPLTVAMQSGVSLSNFVTYVAYAAVKEGLVVASMKEPLPGDVKDGALGGEAV